MKSYSLHSHHDPETSSHILYQPSVQCQLSPTSQGKVPIHPPPAKICPQAIESEPNERSPTLDKIKKIKPCAWFTARSPHDMSCIALALSGLL